MHITNLQYAYVRMLSYVVSPKMMSKILRSAAQLAAQCSLMQKRKASFLTAAGLSDEHKMLEAMCRNFADTGNISVSRFD